MKAAKAIVAFGVSCALGGIAQGLIVGKDAAIVTIVVGALTTAGVYAAKNQT